MIDYFAVDETEDGAWLTLRLSGELDLGSAPVLKHRLEQLRGRRQPVRLDLSGLEFIDSSGIQLLLSARSDAHADGWELEVDPTLSRQVARSLRLAKVADILYPQTPVISSRSRPTASRARGDTV